MNKRCQAANQYIVKKLTSSFKAEWYDGEKESYKMAALMVYIQTIKDVKQMATTDQELAKAMAGATI